jgi:hypothetical protein
LARQIISDAEADVVDIVTARHTEERRGLLKVWIAIYRKD